MFAAISSTFGLLPTPSFSHLITVKLTHQNYLLWKAQFLPYLRSQQLMGFVDGTQRIPAKVITTTMDAGATQAPNPRVRHLAAARTIGPERDIVIALQWCAGASPLPHYVLWGMDHSGAHVLISLQGKDNAAPNANV